MSVVRFFRGMVTFYAWLAEELWDAIPTECGHIGR